MDAFKSHVIRANSVIAAHAMVRALADRKSLGNPKKLLAYLDLVCGGQAEATEIAQRGLAIIAELHAGDISTLGDEKTSAYIKWLGTFVLKRATQGRAPNPDLGRTLLFELRKTTAN